MNNNKLILYKENVFTKISNFLKKLFLGKKNKLVNIDELHIYNNKCKEDFMANILIKEDKEEERLKILQLQYDNGEIDEENITDEDMDKLIEIYTILQELNKNKIFYKKMKMLY